MTGRIDDQRPNTSQVSSEQHNRVARYIHEYLPASSISEERGMFGVGAPQQVATPYPDGRIEEHLNLRAREGWRLFSMEPHWYYERQYISLTMSIAKPLAVIGWYLTFEELGRDSTDASNITDPSRTTIVTAHVTGRYIPDSIICPTCGKDIKIAGNGGQDNQVQCGGCGDEWNIR